MIFNSIKEKYIFFNFPVILFSLIPIFLITGPFLSDLSISLIGILFLIYCFREKNFTFFKNKYFYFFLLFWIYLVLNSLINNFNFDSIKISFFYFRYGVFVIAIVAFLNFDSKFINYFFYCVFVCLSVLLLDGFYQYFYGKNIIGLKSPDSFRVSSFFHTEMILGGYLSRIWPIFFGLTLLILKKKNFLFYLAISIFILSEVLIFLSGDRAAFFFINLTAFFIIIFSRELFKLRLFTLITSILLLIFISFINPTAKQRIINKTINQMNFIKKDNKEEGIYIFSKQHTHHYITAYRMFLDNKILGVGVKNFRIFCSEEKYEVSSLSCSTHPHNTYLQILSETGIVGFLFLITVLFYFCKSLYKHLKFKIKGKKFFNEFEICILSALTIYLWPFVPTGNVFNNWLNIALILNLPFLIWSRNSNKTH